MQQFEYVITEPVGIHARPASILIKAANQFKSKIIIEKDDKTADVKSLFALMCLGIKCGEKVLFTVEGEDEEKAALDLETFCKNNL